MAKIIVTFFCLLFTGAANGTSWVVGLDADLSNVAKSGGQAIQRGIELAIDDINAKGGVLGGLLVLDARDHRGNPARGIANIKSLATQKNLLAIVGGVHTPVAIAELPAIHDLPVIYLDPWAAGTPVINNGYEPNYAFRLSVRDEWAGRVILKSAKDAQCLSVTLLLERTGWGRSNENSMNTASQELDIAIDAIEWFNWNSEILPKLVQNLSLSGVKCLVLVANTPEGAEIISSVAEQPIEFRPKVFSHWGLAGGNFTSLVGLDVLKKVDLSYLQTIAFQAPKTSIGGLLEKAYKAKYGEVPGHNAFNGVAHAYDLVQLLVMAAEQAGSSKPSELQKALENLPEYKGVMKTYQPAFTSERHEALDESDYLMLKFNGEGYGEVK